MQFALLIFAIGTYSESICISCPEKEGGHDVLKIRSPLFLLECCEPKFLEWGNRYISYLFFEQVNLQCNGFLFSVFQNWSTTAAQKKFENKQTEINHIAQSLSMFIFGL